MRLLAAAIVALFVTTAPAFANGAYIEGTVSNTFSNDVEVGNSSYDVKSGFLVGAAVGMLMANAISAELELTYGNRDFDSLPISVKTLAVMANVYYNFQVANAISGYLGLGLGGINYQLEDPLYDESDMVFGYQAILGFAWAVNTASVFLEYRYRNSSDPSFVGQSVDYEDHSVGVGVRIPIGGN